MKKRILPIPMLHFFLNQLKPHTFKIFSLGLLGAFMGLGMGFIGEHFSVSKSNLWAPMALALFTVLIIRTVLSLLSEHMAVKLVVDFRAQMSQKIISQMDYYKLKWSSSEILERLTGDLPVLIDSFTQSFVYLVSQLVLFCIVISIVAIKFPMGLLLIALGTFIYMALALVIKPKIQKKTAIGRKHEARMFQMERNFVEGFDYLKTSNADVSYFNRFIQLLSQWQQNEQQKVTISALTENLSWSLRFVFVVFILGSLVEGIGLEKVDLYWLFLAVGSSSQIFWSIYNYGKILPLVERCEDFFREEPVAKKSYPQDSNQLQIEVKKLTLQFDPRGQTQSGVGPLSFKWSQGDRVWMRGPSGSGKTTLIRVLLGLHGAFDGEVEVPQSDLGYVEQDPFFFDGESLAVNLGITNSEEINQDLIFQLGLANFFLNLPEGLNTIVGREGMSPSRGQKMRLALLRSLLKQPQILILDEPTAGLEKTLAQSVLLFVKTQMSEGLLIVADHREDIVSFLDPTKILDLNVNTKEGVSSWRQDAPKDLSSF